MLEQDSKSAERIDPPKTYLVIPAMNYRGSDGKHLKVHFTEKPSA